jgi:hypothetical protein
MVEDEFLGGGTSSGTVGNKKWNFVTITTPCTGFSYNNATPAPDASHPGVLRIQTSNSNGEGCTMMLGSSTGGSLFAAPGQVVKSTVSVGQITDTIIRVGIHNETTSASQGTSGVWWEYNTNVNATNWYYCYGNGTASATCTSSGIAASANAWARLEIRLTATGAGTSAATFKINGNSFNVSAATIDVSSAVSPAISCITGTNAAAVKNCFVDYYSIRSDATAVR